MITLVVGGCAYQSQPQLDFQTAKYLNPDSQNRQKPIVVGIYQLTQPYPFKSTSYADLTEKMQSSLAETLIDYQTLELKPNSNQTLTITLPSVAHYIGICAGFHRLIKNNWKTVNLIPKTHQKIQIKISISSDRIDTILTEHLL